MAREQILKMRLARAEYEHVKKHAQSLGLPVAQYLRISALSGRDILPKIVADQIHDGATKDQQSELAEHVEGLSAQIVELTDQVSRLVNAVKEMTRIPSFVEFKARLSAEGRMPSHRDPHTWLLALAQDYYRLYGVWPDPHDERSFGQTKYGDYDAKTNFPRVPPG